MYLKSDTLLLADVFKKFRKKYWKIYELVQKKFLSAPRLVWQAALKNTKVKIELLTHIDMLLMVEKGVRGKLCHSINRYVKASNNYYDEKLW